MRYRVKEFSPGLFHVMHGNVPLHDDSRDGDDQPLVFRDGDIAQNCANRLNGKQQWRWDETFSEND